MQFDWVTFALQAINFLVLVWLLRRFLYRPVREVITKRQELAEQATLEAAKQKSDAEAEQQRYVEARDALSDERQQMLKTMHREWDEERRKLLVEAKDEAEAIVAAAREAVAKERQTAVEDIRDQMAGLAVDIASNLLRTVGSDASSEVYLEQIERRLRDLPAEELERLRKDLAAEGAALTVVTATPLEDEERAAWTERLGTCLGQDGRTDFTSDPEILGGAELRFPHAALKFTWADQLRQARELLRADEAPS